MTTDHLGGAVPQGDQNTRMEDVWGWCITQWNVKLMIDIGCGYGHTCKWFNDLGIVVVGVDGWPECIEKTVCQGMVVSNRMILHDFAKGPYVHGTPFDLAWSAEFLEHVEERYLDNLKPSFQAARHVVITHGEPHQHGQHHVNCQPDSYWVKVFKSWGFRWLKKETDLLRTTDRHGAAWGRRSLMAFERL